jgi:hypothetical protein
MAVVAFDLDETLGRFGNLDAFLFFMYPNSVYSGQLKGYEPFAPSEALQAKINTALNAFAECLLAKEPALGMLRPGILDIIRVFVEAKKRGDVKNAAIYSNNGNSGLLLLAKTVIEKALNAPGFFCDLVNWYDPRREREITKGHPGHAAKTFQMLNRIFQDSRCSSGPIEARNVYFFDDLKHDDIYAAIGPENYFKVTPYKTDPPLQEIVTCFLSVKDTTDLFKDPDYYTYIQPILRVFGHSTEGRSVEENFNSVMKCIQSFYTLFISDKDDIVSRLQKRFQVSYGNNYFPIVDGGKSTRKYKKSKHKSTRIKKLIRRRGPG